MVAGVQDSVWAFGGVLVTQGVILALALINRHRLGQTLHHVNHVEAEIDPTVGPTLGQRLARIEDKQDRGFVDNERMHDLMIHTIGRNAVDGFRRAYVFSDDVAAYHLTRTDGDPPWHLEWVNGAWKQLTGLTLEEGQTGQYVQNIHPDDRDRVMDSAAEAMRKGEVWLSHYRVRDRDGGWFMLEQYGEPYRTIDGRSPMGQLGIIKIVGHEP